MAIDIFKAWIQGNMSNPYPNQEAKNDLAARSGSPSARRLIIMSFFKSSPPSSASPIDVLSSLDLRPRVDVAFEL